MAYRPMLGGGGAVPFPLQFPNATIDHNSMAVTLIEHLANDGTDTVVSHGTGFLWRSNEREFLVTARHVLGGKDPFTDDPISRQLYFPERIRIFPSYYQGQMSGRSPGVIVPVLDDGQRLWLEDPLFEFLRTDIGVLPLEGREGLRLLCLNDESGNFADIFTHIGFDCAVVGHPTANVSGLRTPIWRRGTIASEPWLPVDGKPMFLIDAATSPGFSGSPVFRRHIGPAPVKQPDGTLAILAGNVVTTSFVGVYAGRLQHAHYGGEVPFAFYGNRIEAILKAAGF